MHAHRFVPDVRLVVQYLMVITHSLVMAIGMPGSTTLETPAQ